MLTNLPLSQLPVKNTSNNADDMYNTNLLDLNYTVVDLETTGTRPITNQIIEIGIVNIAHGEITDTFQTFVNPGTSIPPFISQMTGITDNDVEYAPVFPDIIQTIMPYLENRIFVAHNAAFDYTFLQKNLRACGVDFNAPKICTVQLSRKLIPQLAHHKLDDLARHFHIEIPNRHRALDDALATGKSLLNMFEILMQTGKQVFGSLTDFTQPSESKKYKILKPTIDELPLTPGIYLMKNKDDQIIYVGKSKCLQKRVRSYFYSSEKKSRKLEKLIETVESIEHITTGSELSALLLESKKIKEHLPVFNKMIRDYKAYPFLKISKEAFPRLYVTREIRSDGATYYGPFKSSSELKHTIERLQKAFKLRPCKHKINPKKPESLKLCMYYELGDCPGVCGGKMSQAEYLDYVEKAKAFLSGNEQIIMNKLETQIDELSESMKYEKAAELRDQLVSLERLLTKQQRIARCVEENNVVIIQEGTTRDTKEIFCVKNGIVHTRLLGTIKNDRESEYLDSDTTLNFDEYAEYQDKKTNQQEDIWRHTLSSIYNNKDDFKVTKENIDDLMIISTWLMQHTTSSHILPIQSESQMQQTVKALSRKYILQ